MLQSFVPPMSVNRFVDKSSLRRLENPSGMSIQDNELFFRDRMKMVTPSSCRSMWKQDVNSRPSSLMQGTDFKSSDLAYCLSCWMVRDIITEIFN